jgi:hypothetical protein
MINADPHYFTRVPERINVLSDKQHNAGVLDPNSKVGKGTLIEYVVLITLTDCVKEDFNRRYDLTSVKFGEIKLNRHLELKMLHQS